MGVRIGGRQKGTRNKKNQAVEETAARLGINLFEALCLFAKGDWKALGYENECYFTEKSDGSVKMGYVISPDMRLRAIESACKYLYTQKREHEVKVPEGIKLIIEDYTKK